MQNKNKSKFILWFDEIGIKDIPRVGGKNASLGEMYRNLSKQKVLVPNGFAITVESYHYLLDSNGIRTKIKKLIRGLDTHDMHNLAQRGAKIRETILGATFPADLAEEIKKAYAQLSQKYKNTNVDVAVRSSATAEDLPDASFAGQQETFLNIRGARQLIEACHKCFASLFTNRAIGYREDKKFDHFSIGLSIGIQKMVRSDRACSGVMFSIDTETGFRNAVVINGSWGLGENVVLGTVNPDEFRIFKPTLKHGKKPILSKKLGGKKIKMIYANDGNHTTVNIKTSEEERQKFILRDEEILQLSQWACVIENYYSRQSGYHKPMDMEWAKDGRSGKLFIVQARPETVQSRRDISVLEKYSLAKTGKIITTGAAVGEKIGAGKARIIRDTHKIAEFKKGEILVTDATDPDWEPIMKIAAAIITNRGGRTCHAAIVSRELGIPCVVGTRNATIKIKNGEKITASCAEGEVGKIYAGAIPFTVQKINLKNLKRTKTKMMLNLGSPEQAFSTSFLPNDGVGLAREEFIINSYIKIHPLALLNFNKLKDPQTKKKIAELTVGYRNKAQFFVDKLASGIATIGAAFYPKPVIVRLSDFKSNEYANLIGGAEFEPHEENPMIGWRGASRYYDPKYQAAFALECAAFRKVREEMGLTNIKIMVPFCRTVTEGKKVLREMKKNGLIRGRNKLEIYMMCEIPANVILADEFSKIFDGFSIGSNDLTQLTLGVDRDSQLVSHIYDERNEAVKQLISSVVKTAKKNKCKIGICGQAPSDFPDFARFLVKEKIDSLSLTPDSLLKTTIDIAKFERKK